jgi:thiol-disulfide isomerase/thioredoxin
MGAVRSVPVECRPTVARFQAGFFALAAVFSVLAWVCAASAGDSRGAAGIDLHGKTVDPLQQAAGKPVVLIFVRTDCPISNRYAPSIQKLQAAYAGRADFWLVYPDKAETSSAIEKHLREYGYKFPALHDPKHEMVAESQARMTPEAAVFDGHGQLVYHGRIDDRYVTFGKARAAPTTSELKDALESVLAGRKPAVASADGVGCYISDLQ